MLENRNGAPVKGLNMQVTMNTNKYSDIIITIFDLIPTEKVTLLKYATDRSKELPEENKLLLDISQGPGVVWIFLRYPKNPLHLSLFRDLTKKFLTKALNLW